MSSNLMSKFSLIIIKLNLDIIFLDINKKILLTFLQKKKYFITEDKEISISL